MAPLLRPRWLLLPVVLGLLLLAPGASAAEEPRDVVVVGVPGLSWSDVTAQGAPAIHDFAEGAAVANLNVRSRYFTSCPADGWLGLSAGNRAALPRDLTRGEQRSDPRALPDCAPLEDVPTAGPSDVSVERGYWTRAREGIAEQGFDARIGALGTAVRDAGGCLTGSGSGVPLALADESGEVPATGGGVHETCPITLAGAPPVTAPGEGRDRAAQVRAADAVVAETLEDVHPDTVVVLAGLSDDSGQPGLRVLAVGGGEIGPGWLRSESTTREDMGQVADITHTALTLAGADPPAGSAGRSLVPVAQETPFAERRAELVAVDDQLRTADEVIPPFFRGYGVALVGALVIAVLAQRFAAPRWRPFVRHVVTVVGCTATALPAATYLATLVDWFDRGSPLSVYALVVGGIALGIAVVALGLVRVLARVGRWGARDPGLAVVGVIGGLTAGLLTVDLLTGGRMTLLSTLGLLPLDGGRFHGLGNVPFAIFAASAFLLVAAVADPLLAAGLRRSAAAAVGALGALALLVDAWLGADGGGALALFPAVGYLVLAVAGVRLTWLRVVGIAVGTVLGFLAIAGLDWLPPEGERTHLGRFFQQLLDGDAWAVVWRKLETNIDLLLGPERVALLVPVVLVVVIWVLARPEGALGRRLQPLLAGRPGLRPALVALVVALTVGFLLNDSGTAIPAAAALVLAPALAVLWVRSPGPTGP